MTLDGAGGLTQTQHHEVVAVVQAGIHRCAASHRPWNGRARKVVLAVISVALPCLLGYLAWAGRTLFSHEARLAEAETMTRTLHETDAITREWLVRIESKLDQAIREAR